VASSCRKVAPMLMHQQSASAVHQPGFARLDEHAGVRSRDPTTDVSAKALPLALQSVSFAHVMPPEARRHHSRPSLLRVPPPAKSLMLADLFG